MLGHMTIPVHMLLIQKEPVSHVSAVTYPNHHTHLGACLVTEKYSGKGYGQNTTHALLDTLDESYTIGLDVDSKLRPQFETRGYETVWNTYIAMLTLDKISKNLARTEFPSDTAVKPLRNVNLEKLLEYDSSVFGTSRRIFVERWINVPGSFGWAAVNENSDEIVGYAVLKQVIRGGGIEIGLAMAPLFADNVHIAKLLRKMAAENV